MTEITVEPIEGGYIITDGKKEFKKSDKHRVFDYFEHKCEIRGKFKLIFEEVKQ